MFGFFKKNKKQEDNAPEPLVKVSGLKSIEYPSMVVLAWAKAVEGDEDLQNWLKDNGYPELFFTVHAIYLQDIARTWLMQNGYAHLMAMINAAEGNEKARKWLIAQNFNTLYHIALAIDHENDSWLWLAKNASKDLIILARSIQFIKDKIEENHNDPHTFRRDL
jgi:hypothetical protein